MKESNERKHIKLPLHAYISESPHSVKECADHFKVSVSYAYLTIKEFVDNGEATIDSRVGNTNSYRGLPLRVSQVIHPFGVARIVSFANQTRPLSNDCIGTSRKSYGWEGYSSPLTKA